MGRGDVKEHQIERQAEFASEYTWASVVLGTGLVLIILRLILPKKHWEKVVLAFVVAGSPMIAQSLWNKIAGMES